VGVEHDEVARTEDDAHRDRKFCDDGGPPVSTAAVCARAVEDLLEHTGPDEELLMRGLVQNASQTRHNEHLFHGLVRGAPNGRLQVVVFGGPVLHDLGQCNRRDVLDRGVPAHVRDSSC
jgi:hypothetical protein